jgi:predicted GNAT family acetyltransferase
MESETAEPTITDVPGSSRVEIRSGDELIGFAAYERSPGRIAFTHTEIDPAFGGRGMGGKLIAAVLAEAREEGLDVLPVCPFVRGYIDKHPEYLSLVPSEERKRFGLPAGH